VKAAGARVRLPTYHLIASLEMNTCDNSGGIEPFLANALGLY
jgi:hypothetical protein